MKQKVHIFIADDDREDLDFLEQSLLAVRPNVVITRFESGKLLIEHLFALTNDQLPSLITMDYNMPILTGLEALRIIKREKRYMDIPVVIMSTSGLRKTIIACRNSGAIEYFVKPNFVHVYTVIAERIFELCNVENKEP